MNDARPGNAAVSRATTKRRAGDEAALARAIGAALSGRFADIKLLSACGPAVHCLARDANGPIRLRLFLEELADGPRQLELFYLEAQAAARLRHDHVIHTGAPGLINGMHVAAVEHRPQAGLLRQLLRRQGWLAPETVVHIARQIIEALGYAHRQDVLHLALSPDCILLAADGMVRLSGFGICAQPSYAWAQAERSARADARYVSPEQAADGALDRRSDLYMVGALLFEMLTDRTPFESDDPRATRRKHLTRSPLPPHTYQPAVPPRMSSVVMRLLEKDPDRRIQDCAALLAALHEGEGARGFSAGHGGAQARPDGEAHSDATLNDQQTTAADTPTSPPGGVVAENTVSPDDMAGVAPDDTEAHFLPAAADEAPGEPLQLGTAVGPGKEKGRRGEGEKGRKGAEERIAAPLLPFSLSPLRARAGRLALLLLAGLLVTAGVWLAAPTGSGVTHHGVAEPAAAPAPPPEPTPDQELPAANQSALPPAAQTNGPQTGRPAPGNPQPDTRRAGPGVKRRPAARARRAPRQRPKNPGVRQFGSRMRRWMMLDW